jgi:putative membrane protein
MAEKDFSKMIRKFLIAGAMLASSAATAAPPAKFLSDAIQGDNSETRLGQLIQSRGSSPGVRQFGTTLVRDHSKARAQAADVARRMHVPVPGSMMPEARTEYAKLQRLHGPAFDREVKRYMIHDHEKDIAKFEQQARSGDRRTAALAQAQLPVLRKHLEMAQSLSR